MITIASSNIIKTTLFLNDITLKSSYHSGTRSPSKIPHINLKMLLRASLYRSLGRAEVMDGGEGGPGGKYATVIMNKTNAIAASGEKNNKI